MQSWRFLLAQLAAQLWLRASLYAAVGVAVALLAAVFSRFVPDALAKPFGGGTVDGLLTVLASALLPVATFSVGAMLTAYTNISQSATPRAAALITGDSRAQSALSTFVGAFLFAVVALSANGTGYYGGGGRAIVFFVTLGVLALVAVTLLRWLDQLLSLARVGHAIAAVEQATARAMKGAFGRAALACADHAEGATIIYAPAVGYVRNVDLNALRKLARRRGVQIWVEASPGAFAEPTRVLARVAGPCEADLERAVAQAFAIGKERSFGQDPRFGMVVLGQIASKALSPGINDPGTAIDVMSAAVRLLVDWLQSGRTDENGAGGVHLARPALSELLGDAFSPVAIDGASSPAVAMRLQRSLAALFAVAGPQDRTVLTTFADEAMRRSDHALDFDVDRARVRAAWDRLAAP